MADDVLDAPIEEQAPAPAAVPKTPSPAPEFDDAAVAAMLQERSAGATQALRTSVTQATGVAPDHAAAVKDVSDQIGVAPDAVERNFEEFKKRATLAQTPYADIVRDTPHTAAVLSD